MAENQPSPPQPNPELIRRMQEARQLIDLSLITIEDQKAAEAEYSEARGEYLLEIAAERAHSHELSGRRVMLEQGSVIYREGKYQRVAAPFPVQIRSIDYDYAMSAPLEDQTIVYFHKYFADPGAENN